MGDEVFKILAIDGGGVKGLYSSTILEHIEKKYNVRTTDYFDMICGTSTGGLIALALSLGISAEDISKIYLENGSAIFPNTPRWLLYLKQALYKGKFTDIALKRVLYDVFGDSKIEQSNNLLCIPSYSIT